MKTKKEQMIMKTKHKQTSNKISEYDVEQLRIIISKQDELIKLLKHEVSDLSCKLSIYRAYYFKFDKDR